MFGADNQILVVRNLDASHQQQGGQSVAVGGKKKRGQAHEFLIFSGAHQAKAGIGGPFAAAARTPPGGEIFVTQEGRVENARFGEGVPLVGGQVEGCMQFEFHDAGLYQFGEGEGMRCRGAITELQHLPGLQDVHARAGRDLKIICR